MSEYFAGIVWELKSGEDFLANQYSRSHSWHFDGGVQVLASSSPHLVPPPHSVAEAVDPEEAFVASLSSCHMLWFLALAAQSGFLVKEYKDNATGTMARNKEGRMAMTELVLKPIAEFENGYCPDNEQLASLHHEAHEKCFIANSVKTNVRIELG